MQYRASLLLIALMLVGAAAVLFAADVTQNYQPVKWGTVRSGVAVADSAAWDGPNVKAAIAAGSIVVVDNRERKPTVRVSLLFSASGANVPVYAVRGEWNGQTFTPRDGSLAGTVTAGSVGTLRGLYAAGSIPVDAGGFSGLVILLGTPSSGTVDVDAGAY